MITKKQVNAISKYAKYDSRVAVFYIFGSHARGMEKRKSDVDIGVLFYDTVTGFDRVDMETDLSDLINENVDLVDMRKASPILRHQIYKYGKVLYIKETDFPAKFRAFAIGEYLDTRYISEKRAEILNGRFKHKG